MKKIFLKLSLLIIIFALFISSNVLANENTFRVSFQSGKTMDAGQTIDVPIRLDNINVDGIQKGVISFSCNINFDNTVFEIIPYADNTYVQISEEMKDYANYTFNIENNKFLFTLNSSYFDEIGDYINNYVEIASIKLKAKETAETGNYELSITNIEGGNDEVNINGVDSISKLYINGIENNVVTEEEDVLGSVNDITEENKEVIIDVKQNEDGSKVTITVDNENGMEVGFIKFNDIDYTSNNGVFEIDTIPGTTNTIKLYDLEGNFLGITYVQTIIKELSVENGEIDNDVTEDKDDEIKEDSDNNDNKQDEDTNIPGDSVQTGDKVYWAIAIILIVCGIWLIVFTKRRCGKN